METQVITITIQTNIDASTLLDIAMEAGHRIAEEVESYGEEVEYDETEVCVESVED